MNNLLLRRITSELGIKYLKPKSCNQLMVCHKNVRQLNTFPNHVLRSKILMKSLPQIKCQPILRTISTSQEINLFTTKLNDYFIEQKRYKKGKKGSKRQSKEESSDEESDAEPEVDEFDPDLIDGKAIGFVDQDATLVSLRLDNVVKTGMSMVRNKVDEAFYNNLIRINGQRVSKKSAEVGEDDEIDLIRGLNQDNQELIDVYRVVIKKIEDKMSSKDRIKVKLRKFRNLTIENYPNDPYDGFAINIIREEKKE